MQSLRFTSFSFSRALVSVIGMIALSGQFLLAQSAYATEIPAELKDVGIVEHLGDTISISKLTFRDENGQSVVLGQYFNQGRPVLLNLVYYGCPSLCTFVLGGLVNSLQQIDWVPGREFELVTISIDPDEKHPLATRKKTAYLESYGKPAAAAGWHFLTGDEDQIKKLASQVGFGYRYDESEGQYAHGAAIFALSSEGKITRYLYGIEYNPKDLRLALLEASNGTVGNVVDRILLFCFRYDPQQRKYSIYLTRLMQTGCGGTVLVFGAYLALFWRRQRKEGA